MSTDYSFAANPIYRCNATSLLGDVCCRVFGHDGRHTSERVKMPSGGHASASWLHDAREMGWAK